MDASNPRVSVVIPNRNGLDDFEGRPFLEMVLPTLRGQSFQDFDVTIVDNGSSDDTVGHLSREWPEVNVIALGENVGFPAAVNRGIQASTGEYIALLNNDLELTPNWIETLVDELDRNPEIGFATGKVMHYDQRAVIEQVGLDLFTCGRFEPRGEGEVDDGQYDAPREIAIATGAAVLYRREAVDRVGAFDEGYSPIYCEDADLCLRMWLIGFRGRYLPEASAYHVRGGYTGRQSDFTRFLVARNSWITMLKDFPLATLVRSLPKTALYQVHMLREARALGFARTLLRAYASFLRRVPGTLRKRWRIQRERVIPAAELERLLRTEYPIPTRFGRQPHQRQLTSTGS